MTMPHLMNCGHSDEGWCLDCVRAEWEATEARLDRARAAYDACREALEIEHGRALEAERARDLLIEMSIVTYTGFDEGDRFSLETAITGREYFATRDEAVARLLDVAGASDDDEPEAPPP